MANEKSSTSPQFRGCLKGRRRKCFLVLTILSTLMIIYFSTGSLKFYELLPSAGCLSAVPRHSLAQQINDVVNLLLTCSDQECYIPKAVLALQAVAQDLDPRMDTNGPLGESSSSAHDHISNSYAPATTVIEGRSQTDDALGEDLVREERVKTLDGDKRVIYLEEDMAHDQYVGKQFRSDTLVKKESLGGSKQKRNICPEVYNKATKSWSRPKCEGIPKLSQVVTIVLIAHNMDGSQVLLLIQHVQKIHHVKISVLTTDLTFKYSGKEEVEVTYLTNSMKLGEILNRIVQTVTTLYVFFGIHLMHFTEYSNLERLIEAMDDLDFVDVAGGSVRDESGLWNHGCSQMGLSNYKAIYESGYHHSKKGCMFCDHISSSFLTRTTVLQDINFSPELGEEVLMRDWYTKLLVNGKVSMVCPDVMFFGQEPHKPLYNHWLQLAEQWSLQKIITEDGKQLDFECKDIGLDCSNMYRTVKNYLLPPCCLDYLIEILLKLLGCLEEQEILYRLSHGSLLSAVKMAGPLPWDFDIDLQVDCTDKPHVFGPAMASCLKSKGCGRPSEVLKTYWTIGCTDLVFDVGCMDNITGDLPYSYRDRPTVINYSSRRVMVSTNPAKTSRDNYGEGYLRHEIHWRFKSSSSSWSSCPNPIFHACQNQFPSDGNLVFMQHRVC